ncbi:hypothetical protein [Promicromonospora soli]
MRTLSSLHRRAPATGSRRAVTVGCRLAQQRLLHDPGGTRWDLQMAASIIAMIPTALIVILLQKHLVKGIATAGIAGR